MSSQLIFLTTGQHFKTGLSRNGINQFLSDYCSRLFYFCEKLRGDLQYNKKKKQDFLTDLSIDYFSNVCF